MRHMSKYENYIHITDEESISKVCKSWNIENFKIVDGLVNVDGDVILSNMNFNQILLNFGEVTGHFKCNKNNLISLEGAPKVVGGNFNCSYNELSSLDHCPKTIGGWFDTSYNKISNLSEIPSVAREINIDHNPIDELFYLWSDVEGNRKYPWPTSHRRNITYDTTLPQFRLSVPQSKYKDFIDALIEHKPIKGKEIIIDRLIECYNEIELLWDNK